MKMTRCLSGLFLMLGLACGGSGGDDGGVDSQVAVPGDGAALFNETSVEDLEDLCEDYNTTKAAILTANEDAMCLGMGVGQAIDNMTANDEITEDFDWAAAIESCEGLKSQCTGMISLMIENIMEECPEKAQEWTECTATNAEVQGCIDFEISAAFQGIAALKGETCSSILSPEGFANFASMGQRVSQGDVCEDLEEHDCDI